VYYIRLIMSESELKVASALQVFELTTNGKKIEFFSNFQYRYQDNENTKLGTYSISIVNGQYRLITNPSLGNFRVHLEIDKLE